MSVLATSGLSRSGVRSRLRPPAVCREAIGVWLAVVAFIGTSAWWFTANDALPDWDSGVHMGWAILARDEMLDGRFTEPWVAYTSYPPLQHVVGGLILMIFGMHPAALLIGANVVFVPLLAFGCYGTGRILAGPRAGLLAAVIALGAPMFVSEMHMYEPDPEQTAMIAIAVWALLASDGWRRPGVSTLGGVLAGLALLTKETSVVFLAGPVLVTAARGGLRRRQGAVRYLGWLLIVAGPWYALQLHGLLGTFGSIAELAPDPVQAPPILSFANVGWYVWDLLNQQLMGVLGVSALIGLAVAVRRCRAFPRVDNRYPEIVAGAFVSYAGMTLLTHKDPRYTLPALVYSSVLASAWVATLRVPRARTLLCAALVVDAAVLFAGVSFGIGGPVRIGLPDAPRTAIDPWQLVLYDSTGWIRGGPQHDGALLGLVRAMPGRGIRRLAVDTGPNSLDFNWDGVHADALMSGVHATATRRPGPGSDAFLFTLPAAPGDPAPCQRLLDGEDIYLATGNVSRMSGPVVRDLPAGVRLRCPVSSGVS